MKKSIYGLLITTLLLSNSVVAECRYQHSEQASEKRFTINEGQIFDAKTNLTWQRCSLGTHWSSAESCTGKVEYLSLREAKERAALFSDGWRLPNIEELFSLLDMDCTKPSINTKYFPDLVESVEGSPYWSSTEVSDLPILFYFIDFWNGNADGHTEGFHLAVRLVKSS
ncbi:DUF1566 domain-containing protein [Marinomonas sp. S3726]|uniref:Lcl C-terminal domain-containing protein n=1 Tax=Marinomonas sp. S3726 TaxID=579484 RepID=UPI000697F7CF|nr:DUF1566 domain-containing protein [Marinomonas sp. S3726]